MDRAQKQTEVTEIKDRFGKMASAVLTDFRGLNVEMMNDLRREFGKIDGIEYKVVKNTLVKLAIKEEGYSGGLDEHLAQT